MIRIRTAERRCGHDLRAAIRRPRCGGSERPPQTKEPRPMAGVLSSVIRPARGLSRSAYAARAMIGSLFTPSPNEPMALTQNQ